MFFLNFKKVLVAGLGRSGFSAALLAADKGFAVNVIDQGSNDELIRKKNELEEKGIVVNLGYSDDNIPECDFIIASPGIFPRSGFGKLVFGSGRPVISEIEFASAFCKAKTIGITGTNGKTTVTELMSHVLRNAGRRSVAAGNIGTTFSEIVLSGAVYDFIVLELSSFQLEYVYDFAPDIATILNITSDHINWHGGIKAYAEAKARIFRNIRDYTKLVLNANIESFMSDAGYKNIFDAAYKFSSEHESDFFVKNDKIFFRDRFVGDYRQISGILPWKHNLENFLSVLGMCHAAGLSLPMVFNWTRGFKLGSHRLELVADSDGIKYINDSKSTNPDSTITALNAVGGLRNVCLIAGGLDKDMDFSSLLSVKDRIKKIFIIGKSTTKLENICGTVLNYAKFDLFEDAVNTACDTAEKGDIVLLSPGFASMDMFKNYIERGNSFKYLITKRIQGNEKK